MNIVSQNYNNLLKNMIFNVFSQNLKEKLNSLDVNHSVFNYVNLLSSLDNNLNELAKSSLISIFESIDNSFKVSPERKAKYEIKSYHPRTILTIFGEITFNRTFYKSKVNGKNYCFVDRYLGLHKYDYFDPYLKALIVEYAANNSCPKTAKYINDLIGNRLSIKDKFKYLSRQSIRNIILSSKFSKVNPNYKENTPETLYIMADEKWIPTQNNSNSKVMEKSVVVFEGIKNHKLVHKHIFASLDSSFLNNSIDYIFHSYNLDKIKKIFIMGDGAKWIQNLIYEYKLDANISVSFCLDRFHFKQAIHHLIPFKDIEEQISYYFLHDDDKNLFSLLSDIIKRYPERNKTITDKISYLVNHWQDIHNLDINHLTCPMEAQISHNIAALFTSRPKAYSINMINKLTEIRLLFKNNYNIKELYLNNFNSTTTLSINDEFLDFDIFDKKKQFIPYYQDKLFNPILQSYF